MPISSRPLQLQFARAGAAATALTGALVLLSWLSGIDPLNVMLPGGGTMKPNKSELIEYTNANWETDQPRSFVIGSTKNVRE